MHATTTQTHRIRVSEGLWGRIAIDKSRGYVTRGKKEGILWQDEGERDVYKHLLVLISSGAILIKIRMSLGTLYRYTSQ